MRAPEVGLPLLGGPRRPQRKPARPHIVSRVRDEVKRRGRRYISRNQAGVLGPSGAPLRPVPGVRAARAGCRAVRDSTLAAWYGSIYAPRRRSERQHRPASLLPHECRSAGRTMDATDTAAPETRYCGRSQALLYNTIRPHASIGYKPPAPEVFVPAFAAWPAALRRPASPATLAQRPTLN